MKRTLILSFALFFLLAILLQFKNETYAYVNCAYYEINPIEVSTLDLVNYLNKINYNELISFCSYDNCYEVREGNIQESIDNFNKLYLPKLSDDERLIINLKGFPVTKIIINNC